MMLRRLLFTLALACVGASSAPAQLLMLNYGGGGGGPSYIGPGDVKGGALAWWGLRAFTGTIKNAGTQALVNLRRASDSHTCDILVSSVDGGMANTASCSTGGDNGQTAPSFCNATTCLVVTAYDQTGNTHHVTQATAGNQPPIAFSCLGSLPCIQSVIGKGLGTAATVGWTQPASFSMVAGRTASFTTGGYVIAGNTGAGNPSMGPHTSADTWKMDYLAIGTNTFTASDSVMHAVQMMIGSTAPVNYVNVDGGNTTLTSRTGSNNNQTLFCQMNGNCFEGGVWDGISFTTTEAGNMCHNQYLYWGLANSC